MSEFNLGQFITKVVNYSLLKTRGTSTESTPKSLSSGQESFSNNLTPQPQVQKALFAPPMRVLLKPIQNMPMNHLEILDKALYVKDLMKLPSDMKELLNFVKANLNASNNSSTPLSSNLSLSQLALFLQQNGKSAVNKLIMAMSNASRQGVEDLSMMKETMKLINASVSLSEKNPSLVLKSLVLLYLPWLPLQPGVDFELQLESSEDESQSSEASINILISTKNFGNIKVTLVLLSGNSITVLINCSDSFPKDDLLKRINAESGRHSIQSSVIVETKADVKKENATQQSKIDVSKDSTVNPFLVLMANSIIRNVIEIDNNGL